MKNAAIKSGKVKTIRYLRTKSGRDFWVENAVRVKTENGWVLKFQDAEEYHLMGRILVVDLEDIEVIAYE